MRIVYLFCVHDFTDEALCCSSNATEPGYPVDIRQELMARIQRR